MTKHRFRQSTSSFTPLATTAGGSHGPRKVKAKRLFVLLALFASLSVSACTPEEITFVQNNPHVLNMFRPSYGNMIRAEWSDQPRVVQERMVRIAACESGGHKESGINPLAKSRISTAFGIFQFLDRTWKSTGIAKTSDAYMQIRAGRILWNQRGFSPWECKG